jgi:FtsK/SpoIIIE family
MNAVKREHHGLFLRLLRVAWGRRLESGLALAATAARVALVHLLGALVGPVLLALFACAFVVCEPSRSCLLKFYRRERTERRCEKAFDRAGIEIGCAPALISHRLTRSGAVYGLALSPRLTAEDLSKRSEPLAVAFGAASVRVSRDRAHAGRAQLVVCHRDTLAEEPVAWPWVGLKRSDLWGGLPLGYDEDDSLVIVGLAGHHLLLGGEPGAGKSNALSLVVGAAALDPAVELWCFDGKLVELAHWRRCSRRFVGSDLEAATSALRELRADMESRYAWMLERGLRKIDRGSGPGLVVVVIDELALYLQGKSKARDELAEVLRDIVARGRAAGVVVVAATQKPSSDIIPTSIRDLFGCRLALRCATRDASDTVLGVGWASEGFSASEIDPATRGVGYLLAEGTVPRRMRCFVLSDDHLAHVAKRAELLRGTAL